MTPSRILVTGAAGRIGRAVLDRLAADGTAATALVLEPAGDLTADRVVVGDAADPDVVATALDDVDAVIHLAAIPSPLHDPPDVVFGTNTRATFTVLEQAGRRGVANVMVAGSMAAMGLAFAPRELRPAHFPIDGDSPDQPEDPYALSKVVDERTAAMMARRHGMTVVGVRYPYVGGLEERLARHAEDLARDPALGVRELWAYLDVRDAARAAVAALAVSASGAHVVNVAAPRTLVPLPTMELLRTYYPDVPVRAPILGRDVPVDTSVARELLGFTADFVLA